MRLIDMQDRKRHHLDVAESLRAGGIFPKSFADASMRNHLALAEILEERIMTRAEPDSPTAPTWVDHARHSAPVLGCHLCKETGP